MPRQRIPRALLLGLALFLLHNAAVISGALFPPEGYVPAWTLRNSDVPQYLTWIEAARDGVLLPNYHAPWQTGPALWQPLMLLAAWTGLPSVAAYYALSASLYFAAAYALLYALSVFCPGRQGWFVFAAILCEVPFRLFGWMVASAFHSLRWQVLFVSGLLDFGYDTADGLFRGGVSNTPTLSAGTFFVLLAMALLAKFLETAERRYLHALLAATFLSALFHPFEVFAITAAAAVPMILKGRWRAWIALGAVGVLGMGPYLAMGVRSEWLRDTSELIRTSFHPFWILADYGIPFLLTAYLLLIRFRMPEVRDWVLQSWFLCVPLLVMAPGIPFQLHLLNGYAYCIAFLFVRRVACDRQILPLLQRSTKASYRTLAVAVTICLMALGTFWTQVFQDGRRAEPAWLINAIRPSEELMLLQWLKDNTSRDSLIVAPGDLSPWIAAIPRHSLASHDFFSITFAEQREAADRFFKGEPGLLTGFGARIAIIPASSPAAAQMPAASLRTQIGPWKVFEFPSNAMKPYPGLPALKPTQRFSLRHRVMQWLAGTRQATLRVSHPRPVP